MKWVSWNDKLLTGNAGMDHGHKDLMDLINQLAKAMENNKPKEFCSSLLDQFVEHTRTHFLHEEALMDRLKYPKAREHKDLHAMLIKDVLAFKAVYDAGESAEFMTLLVILDTWLNRDIMSADKALADFAAAAG
jgi:methyl-accepting chemotaxis protein/hemerythrin